MTPRNSKGITNPRRLISFDIDGTMEFGDPPGQVTAQWVKLAKEQGNLVGSASDRPLAEQRRVWAQTGIELDFVILKHWMLELRTTFQADEYWHVGDGQMDQLFAQRAGFTFFLANTFPQDVLTHVNGQNGFGPASLPKE
ncbi:MAG: HAD family hydrolase [Chloroflexota bacterium]